VTWVDLLNNRIVTTNRNEYTDWDRPSALDDLSMRDSLSLALSDALVVAPLMHVVHLHAQRSTNPSGTFFYHFQGQMLASVIQQQVQDVDLSEYHVSVTIDFRTSRFRSPDLLGGNVEIEFAL
jgi:neuroligin